MKDFGRTLKGNRVELRTLAPTFDNARMMFATVDANRAHLLPWMEWAAEDKTKSAEDIYDTLKKWQAGRESGKEFQYGIFLSGAYVGCCGVFDVKDSHKTGEIGYWLTREAAGKGYASESVCLLEDEAFAGDGLNRILIKCDPDNLPSVKVAEHNGYRLDGVLRSVIRDEPRGKFCDRKVYSKLKSEWEAKR